MNLKTILILTMILLSVSLCGCIDNYVDRPNTITYTCKVLSYEKSWNGNVVRYIDTDGTIHDGTLSSDDSVIYSDRNEIVITYNGMYPVMDRKTAVLYINESVMT